MAFTDGLLVGSSAVMREVRRQLRDLAKYDVPVSLRGESGTGKGVAARFLHAASGRARGPFVALPMTMLTPGLELDRFAGHAAGAFTDAKHDLPGAVEAAHGGTLLVDELGDATPVAQGILLHVLEDQQIQRQGEHRSRAVDVRLIVATNRDLEQAVREHTFREDLYHRLPAFGLTLPPLRERLGDLAELADALMARASARYRIPPRPLGSHQLERLAAFSWPGNVRELDHVLERWLVQGTFPPQMGGETSAEDPLAAQVKEAVARHAGKKSAAARELGVSRTTVYRRLGKDDGRPKV